MTNFSFSLDQDIRDQLLAEDTETLNQVINPPVDEAEGQDEAKEESETPRESKNTVLIASQFKVRILQRGTN